MNNIGDRIRDYRLSIGMSQNDMAQKMGENQKTWYRYENNTTFPPKDVLQKLVDIFNFNLHWLITGEGQMFVEKAEEKKDTHDKKETEEKGIRPFGGYVLDDSRAHNTDNKKEDFKSSTTTYILEDTSSKNKDEIKNISLIKVINGIQKSNYAILLPDELRKYEGRIIAAVMNGDDMEPTIKKNTVALCDASGYGGAGVYVIKLDGRYIIKRVYFKDNVFAISSDNKMYEGFEIPIDSDRIKIGGQVRCLINIF